MKNRLALIASGFAASALCIAGVLGGCETMTGERTPTAAAPPHQPSIALSSTHSNIAVGEVTTFTVSSQNVLGRNAQVRWNSTGGEMLPEDNGRIARARFNQPGAYTVTAVLIVDGQEFDRDSQTINVHPLR